MELTRGLTQETLSALSGAYFYHLWLVDIDWPSGRVRVHNGVGDIVWDGATWHGVGDMGAITLPEETSGIASFPATFEIIGLPETVVDYLDEPVRNKEVKVFGAVTTERGNNIVVGEPFELWSGYVDAMMFKASVSGKSLEYGIRLEVRGGPCVRALASVYHTPEDQSAKYPGDTAGRLTINAEAEGSKLTWPES